MSHIVFSHHLVDISVYLVHLHSRLLPVRKDMVLTSSHNIPIVCFGVLLFTRWLSAFMFYYDVIYFSVSVSLSISGKAGQVVVHCVNIVLHRVPPELWMRVLPCNLDCQFPSCWLALVCPLPACRFPIVKFAVSGSSCQVIWHFSFASFTISFLFWFWHLDYNVLRWGFILDHVYLENHFFF